MLRVALLENDVYASCGLQGLLCRDPRTTLVDAASSSLPDKFCQHLAAAHKQLETRFDMVVISLGSWQANLKAENLVSEVRRMFPQLPIVCLGSRMEIGSAASLIKAGTNAVLLKEETWLGLVGCLLEVSQVDVLVSEGLEKELDYSRMEKRVRLAPAWEMDLGLSGQLLRVAVLKLLYGMSARAIAKKMALACETIDKYVYRTYQVVFDEKEVDEQYSKEEKALLEFTHYRHKTR